MRATLDVNRSHPGTVLSHIEVDVPDVSLDARIAIPMIPKMNAITANKIKTLVDNMIKTFID